MIRSMTGYGRGECTLYERKFVVEIKSVNHRYNDITIKLPRVMNAFEDRLRKKISGTGAISRGKTDVYVNFESFAKDDTRIVLNEALADAYVEQLQKMTDRYQLADMPSLSVITRFPDVLTAERTTDDEKTQLEMWETLERAADQAVAQILQMREREGDALKTDILAKLTPMWEMLAAIEARAPSVQEDYAARLKNRLSEAIAMYKIDEQRLLAEITVFADKACIDEEIARLKSHLAQLKTILDETDPIGRKLDFLVQEVNREINTIGSKSNDAEITKIVIDFKSEVEKIREQVQNLE